MLTSPVFRQILTLMLVGAAIVNSQNVTSTDDKTSSVADMLPIAETVHPAALADFENNNQTIHLQAFPILPFIALCVSISSLAVSSMSLHNAMNPGWCGVCIERNTRVSGSINMNFEDVAGEANWNLERFDSGLQRDCTNERISGSRQLRKVDFLSHDGVHCVCRIYVTCHKEIAGFDRAWVNLDGDFLTEHYLRTWPNGNPTKDYCPKGCAMLSKMMDGMHGMRVMTEALKCSEDDNECKHKHVQMWD
ncbi:hypothetical protein PINS_up007777 [Pythium insidiosum]|nr:hypothetical protein PINS_up007777 [Pythium insidiosum]